MVAGSILRGHAHRLRPASSQEDLVRKTCRRRALDAKSRDGGGKQCGSRIRASAVLSRSAGCSRLASADIAR